MVLGCGQIFQLYLTSQSSTQAYACNNDTIMTLQEKNHITNRLLIKVIKKKRARGAIPSAKLKIW